MGKETVMRKVTGKVTETVTGWMEMEDCGRDGDREGVGEGDWNGDGDGDRDGVGKGGRDSDRDNMGRLR